jgi:hypothetical protein
VISLQAITHITDRTNEATTSAGSSRGVLSSLARTPRRHGTTQLSEYVQSPTFASNASDRVNPSPFGAVESSTIDCQ